MELTRIYGETRFDPDTIADALKEVREETGDKPSSPSIRVVKRGNDTWNFDSDEEFIADYRKGCDFAHLIARGSKVTLKFALIGRHTEVAVEAESRPDVERMAAVFDRQAERCRIPPPPKPPPPPPPKPVVFIGHGRSPQWRDLKDHLHHKHGYSVEAYEIGERAGHTIRDILESMLRASSFALLVMTGEDQQHDGAIRARQNVVHELGLFQGRLGFNRAVVLLEEGTEDFSNLQGIHQIRYASGNVKETFGDVLAALRREFPG